MKSYVLKYSPLVFISFLTNQSLFANPFQLAELTAPLGTTPSVKAPGVLEENAPQVPEQAPLGEPSPIIGNAQEKNETKKQIQETNFSNPNALDPEVKATTAVPPENLTTSKIDTNQPLAKNNKITSTKPRASSPKIDLKDLQERIQILEYKHMQELKSRVIDPVLALPQINFRSKYDTAPIYNQDQAMLIMRKNYEKQIARNGIHPIPMPRIEIGGNLVALALRNTGPNAPPINGAIQSDIQLSGANLNIISEILQYCMGSLRLSYDPSPPFRFDPRYNAGYITTRVNNSNIFLNTGIITLGDLSKAPVYLSLGQMFLPFGEYGSSLATAILPARLGRFRQRAILFGVKQPGKDSGWDFQAFAFRGDTRSGIDPQGIIEYIDNTIFVPGGRSGVIDNGGVNIGYKGKMGGVSFSSGFSYVLNIADSGGMQNSGASNIVDNGGLLIDNNFLDNSDLDDVQFSPDYIVFPKYTFAGFGANRNFLVHGVPAVDFRGKLNFEQIPITFMGEVVACTRPFDSVNLSYNTNFQELRRKMNPRNISLDDAQEFLWGAKPVAWHLEASYRFGFFGIPSALTIGGGQSLDAMALNIPASMMLGTFRLNFKSWLSLAVNYMYQAAYPFNGFGSGELQPSTTDNFAGTNQQMFSGQLTARF
jgi:hypothetical protein